MHREEQARAGSNSNSDRVAPDDPAMRRDVTTGESTGVISCAWPDGDPPCDEYSSGATVGDSLHARGIRTPGRGHRLDLPIQRRASRPEPRVNPVASVPTI